MTNLFMRTDGTTIGSDKILSCEYISQVNTSTDFSFGCITAKAVTVEVLGTLTDAVSAGEALTYKQVLEDGSQKTIGVFYVETPTIATKSSYQFTAYDSISKLDKDLSTWLYSLNTSTTAFPMTLSAFATAVCEQCGVTLSTTTFTNSTYEVQKFYSDGITGRDLMGMVAELAGKFVYTDASGNILLGWFTENTTARVVPSNSYTDDTDKTNVVYYSGELSYENYTTPVVNGVKIHDATTNDVGVVYPTTATDSLLELSNNILLTSSTAAQRLEIAQNLYNLVSTLTYTPCTFKVPRNWLISAGDILEVHDIQGKTFTTLVMKVTMESGGMTGVSTGSQSRNTTSVQTSRKYENIYGRTLVLEMTCEGLTLDMQDLEGRQTTVEASVEGLNLQVKGSGGTAWAAGTEYAVNDVVTYSGKQYVCITAHTSGTTFDSTYWEETIGQKYSEVSVTADKINWLVSSGTSASDFTLTDRTAELVTSTISLAANVDNFDGTVSVATETGAKYGFTLGDDGYYTAANVGVIATYGSYAVAKVSFTASKACMITMNCIHYSSSTDDYGYIGNLDTDLSTTGVDDDSLIFKSFKGESSEDAVEVVIPVTAGTHYFCMKFLKKGSLSANDNYFKFKQGSAKGDSATLTLKGGEAIISSATITFNGLVSFTDLATSGYTTINGDNITTGTINAIDIWGSKFGIKDGETQAYLGMAVEGSGTTNPQYDLNFVVNTTEVGFIAADSQGVFYMGNWLNGGTQLRMSSTETGLGNTWSQVRLVGTKLILDSALYGTASQRPSNPVAGTIFFQTS